MDYIIKTTSGLTLKNLYQWDKNQKIQIIMKPDNKFFALADINPTVEIHFYTSKSKTATIASGELDKNTITTMIPNELLEEGLDISFYIYVIVDTENSGPENTIASGNIPVISRIEKSTT